MCPAGGAKVLDGIGAELQLTEKAMEPSRAVLYDYGNVSSSTTWYTLGWVESVKGVRKGDKILQVRSRGVLLTSYSFAAGELWLT